MDGALNVERRRRWGHHTCVKCRVQKRRDAFSRTPTTHPKMCCDDCRSDWRPPSVPRTPGLYLCRKCLEQKPKAAFSLAVSRYRPTRCDDCRHRRLGWRAQQTAARQAARAAREAQRQIRAKQRAERKCGQRLPPNERAPFWSPQRVADLERALAVDGLSYAEAGERFGVTRCAISGVVTRHLPHLRKSPSSPHAPALRRGDGCVRKVGG